MTIYYVSPLSGDDSTGDGSAANPWKHIGKANENVTDGDEVRVEATTANTDLSGTGTATPTNGSNIITTSADFTGVLSAGDYFTFDSSADGGGNGAAETVYRVHAITASQITIYYNYHGASSGVASTVYKINPVVQTYETTYGARFNIDGCSISGGWTDITGTPTRNSYTFLKNQNPRTGTSYYAMLANTSSTVSHLNFVDYYYGIYSTTGVQLSYCTSWAYRWGMYLNSTSEYFSVDNCVGIGAEYASDSAGLRHVGDGNEYTVSDSIFYGYKYCVYDSYADTAITFDTCYFYGCRINGTGGANTYRDYFVDCTWDSNFTDAYAQYGGNVFENCTFNNSSYCSIYMNNDVDGNYFVDCTWNGCDGTFGAIYNYRCHVLVEGCTFNNCTYGVRSDVLSKSTVIRDSHFDTPITYGIYVHGRGSPAFIEGCTVDAPSSSKALYATIGGFLFPAYSLRNSFGLGDTLSYDAGSISVDATTTYNSKPTIKVSYSDTKSDYSWKPLFKVMVNSGVETTFDWYHKFDTGWSNDLDLRFTLNGIPINSPTDITSFPTSFTNITRTAASGDITEDGVLALEFRVLGKPLAKSFWVGGFSV